MWWVLKGNKKDTVNLKDYTIVVTKLTPSIPKGGTAQIKVDITNKTGETLAPTLRFDMWPSSWGHSPIEGEPVSVGDIEAGETVSTTISYELPSDWGSGLNSQLMLIGLEAPVWTGTFTVTPEGQVITIDPGAEGVEAINPRLVVGSRATAKVNAIVNNLTAAPISRSFRLDLKKGSDPLNPAPGWNNGTRKAFTLQPGPNPLLLESIPVPADWGTSNSPVAAKIMDMGQTAIFWGDLGGSDVYRIFELVATQAQAYLQITSPGLAGFEKKCIDIGQSFKYTCSVNNTYTAPLTGVDFIIGFRDSASGTYTEQSTPKTIPVGVSPVTFLSKVATATWNDAVVDLRVLIRHGATITVQGTTPQEDAVAGKLDDKIYEGADVGHIGPSYLANIGGESLVDSMIPADRLVSRAGGTALTFNLRYKHRGPSKNYKCGVWIKDNGTDGGYWIINTFTAAESANWVEYEVALRGTFRATPQLHTGQDIDCLFVFMEATVTPAKPPQTQQFLFANEDKILRVKA